MDARAHFERLYMRSIHNLALFIGKIYIEKMISRVRLMSMLYASNMYKYKLKLLLKSLIYHYVKKNVHIISFEIK